MNTVSTGTELCIYIEILSIWGVQVCKANLFSEIVLSELNKFFRKCEANCKTNAPYVLRRVCGCLVCLMRVAEYLVCKRSDHRCIISCDCYSTIQLTGVIIQRLSILYMLTVCNLTTVQSSIYVRRTVWWGFSFLNNLDTALIWLKTQTHICTCIHVT